MEKMTYSGNDREYPEINIEGSVNKKDAVNAVECWVYNMALEALEINDEKPWGAYWKIDEEKIELFLSYFFPEMTKIAEEQKQNMSPKLLLVAPNEQLSWQYHSRRAENWKVVMGDVAVKIGEVDKEPVTAQLHKAGDLINIDQGMRHRLIGREGWGLVAEVWTHTNPEKPSDEEDIVRLADDYGREVR